MQKQGNADFKTKFKKRKQTAAATILANVLASINAKAIAQAVARTQAQPFTSLVENAKAKHKQTKRQEQLQNHEHV